MLQTEQLLKRIRVYGYFDKLRGDWSIFLGFMFRERKLMEKLAKVDRDSLKQEQMDEQENNDISVDEFIEHMFGHTMDEATRQRVEQLIEVNQLIESVTVNEEGEGHISNLEKIKALLAKVKPKSTIRGYSRSFEPNPTDRDSRPYRDLNARGPAYKGESYVPPKSS